MTMLGDQTRELAFRSESNAAALLPLLAPDELRAPIVSLSPAKRAALVACFKGGSLHKRDGVWTGLSPTTFDKPVAGVTVADLARDGMLMLSMLPGRASARLTARGSWFARTALTEMAKRDAP